MRQPQESFELERTPSRSIPKRRFGIGCALTEDTLTGEVITGAQSSERGSENQFSEQARFRNIFTTHGGEDRVRKGWYVNLSRFLSLRSAAT